MKCQVLLQSLLSNDCEFSEAYIDDIVVFSPDFESRLNHITLVLQKLIDHGLTVKSSKCLFGCTKF